MVGLMLRYKNRHIAVLELFFNNCFFMWFDKVSLFVVGSGAGVCKKTLAICEGFL